MKIGMMGLECSSPNKGCEALTYSFINMVREIVQGKLELHIFGYVGLGSMPQKYPDIKFVVHRLKLKNPLNWFKLKKEFNQMDCIVDATFGDGFSDIYGKKWNVTTNLAKQIAISSKAPFVLLPQTYGPYYSPFLKRWAHKLIKKADVAFARDTLSAKEVNAVIGKKIIEATDLAFALPFNRDVYMVDNTKTNIGLNVSGLLWNGGHADTIKLKTNYRQYCQRLVEYFMLKEDVVIHLIPHVINKSNYNGGENDVKACNELHQLCPKTILAPHFSDPIEAKSYISNMDVFLGARMHSTIGSFSSGVVTIPFSYSKKFEGLFGNLNYPYIISATQLDTDEAINRTIQYIENKKELLQCQERAMVQVKEKLNLVNYNLNNILYK